MKLDKAYWAGKYQNNLTGWDTGAVTTPIKEYIDQLDNKEIKILIPGCGNGHEAAYLYDNGFSNVTVVDIADAPIKALEERCSGWPKESFIVGDFFKHLGQYELILEQTFFCALDPALRESYANKTSELLTQKGQLVGLLFTFPLEPGSPPFGGDPEEYRSYFEKYYNFIAFDPSYNSIKPRMGAELWINLQKRG